MVSEEAFRALREITGKQVVTASLLGCLDTPNVKVAVLSWAIEFLKQQRESILYTIKYAARQGGFEPSIATMKKRVSKIDVLLASLD